MENGEFIQYIGNYRVHDGRIKRILQENNKAKVIMESMDKEEISIEFFDVKSIESLNPEGMMLYGICEVKTEDPFREFCFLNWDEERDEFLKVIAKEYNYVDNN